jgi:hypothetical protein
VLDVLDTTGLARNTLVIYTSDHGEMAGEHGCWWKSNYYEGSAGVPLLARWPGVVASGATSRSVCNLMDIGPTLMELAGTTFPYPVNGRSLGRILRNGRDERWLDETFSELVDLKMGAGLSIRMIRSGDWKLLIYGEAMMFQVGTSKVDITPIVLGSMKSPSTWTTSAVFPGVSPHPYVWPFRRWRRRRSATPPAPWRMALLPAGAFLARMAKLFGAPHGPRRLSVPCRAGI